MSGDLPDGWELVQLPDLISLDGLFSDGDWVESKDQDPDGSVRLVQLADVGVGEYRDRSSRFMTPAKAEALGCTFLNVGDILVSRLPDPLGRACRFPGDQKPCVTVVDVAIVRCGELGPDHDWLTYWINSPHFRVEVLERKSGTTRARISRKNLGKIQFPIPPEGEQHRIVTKLDALFSHSRKAKQALEAIPLLLERYRQSVLAAACSGRLTEVWRRQNPDVEPAEKLLERIRIERRKRWEEDYLAKQAAKGKTPKNNKWKAKYKEPEPVDTEGLPELPEGWCWTTIDFIGEIQNGRQLASPKAGQETRPYLRIANIKDDYIDFDDVREMAFDADKFQKHLLQDGDIIVSGGQSLWKVGQSAIYRSGMPSSCIQKNLFRLRSFPASPAPEFSQLVCRAWVRTGVFRKQSSITTNLAYMSTDRFAECPYPLPPVSEQTEILRSAHQALSAVDQLLERCEEQSANLSEFDQGLLQNAFQGRLVPQDPNDEPASVLLERIRAEREAQGPKKKARGRKRALR